MGKVLTGLDRLVAQDFQILRRAKVAVLANQASVDSQLRHLVDLLHAAAGVEAVKIFGPEHGLRGALQDMAGVSSAVDPQTKLPVISLYGGSEESLSPRRKDLDGIDILVIDLPDVGSRYYTYAQTMALAMKVCGSCGIKVVVLDRPNPINGETVEGGELLKSCRSFCGFTPVAHRHGLTLGELARVYQAGFGAGDDAYPPISCELEVVSTSGWERAMYFDQTGLPWVLPSPNMPTLEAAVVYPGMCLFEATNISEGRGTTKPFEFAGAPFIDAEVWAQAALQEKLALRGAVLRPVCFQPQFHKWAGQLCRGVQLHVTDRQNFTPLRWGLALISAARKLYPEQFSWRQDAYEFVDKVPAIDLLFGSPQFRQTVDGGADLSGIEQTLSRFEERYRTQRREFLL